MIYLVKQFFNSVKDESVRIEQFLYFENIDDMQKLLDMDAVTGDSEVYVMTIDNIGRTNKICIGTVENICKAHAYLMSLDGSERMSKYQEQANEQPDEGWEDDLAQYLGKPQHVGESDQSDQSEQPNEPEQSEDKGEEMNQILDQFLNAEITEDQMQERMLLLSIGLPLWLISQKA